MSGVLEYMDVLISWGIGSVEGLAVVYILWYTQSVYDTQALVYEKSIDRIQLSTGQVPV